MENLEILFYGYCLFGKIETIPRNGGRQKVEGSRRGRRRLTTLRPEREKD